MGQQPGGDQRMGRLRCLCNFSMPDRVNSGAHMHHHLWSSSWPVVCLPLPTPWHRLHSLYLCWGGSTLVLDVDHKCWHPHWRRIWFLPVHLPRRHHLQCHHHHHNHHHHHLHNHDDNYYHRVICDHNYNPGVHKLHPRHVHDGGLQHLRVQLQRPVRLQHPHLLGQHQHNHNNNNNHNHNYGSPLNMHCVLRTCCRPVLRFPLHLWRHHLLRLRRMGLWRGAPRQAVVQHQGRLHWHPCERGG